MVSKTTQIKEPLTHSTPTSQPIARTGQFPKVCLSTRLEFINYIMCEEVRLKLSCNKPLQKHERKENLMAICQWKAVLKSQLRLELNLTVIIMV